MDQQIESCEVSLNVLQQQVQVNQHHSRALIVIHPWSSFSESFQKQIFFFFVSAGEFVQPESPSDAGVNQEPDGSTGASPVPSPPGPVLSLSATPAGPRADSAGDRCWQHPCTVKRQENTETLY